MRIGFCWTSWPPIESPRRLQREAEALSRAVSAALYEGSAQPLCESRTLRVTLPLARAAKRGAASRLSNVTMAA